MKKTRHSIAESLCIPENLDLRQIFPDVSEKVLDYYRYFCHLLYMMPAFNRKLVDGWCPLNMRMLQLVMSHHAATVKKGLLAAGVVEMKNNGQYFQGKQAICYRLTEKYRESEYVRVPIQKKTLERQIVNDWKCRRGTPKKSEHKMLNRWLNHLSIDFGQAMDIIRESPERQSKKNAYKQSAELIRDKRFFFTADDYGRIHTNVANLPKIIRGCLRYKNRELKGLDIANSQPFFLAVMLAKEVETIAGSKISPSLPISFPFLVLPSSSYYDTQKVKEYLLWIELSCNGGLYEYIVKHGKIAESEKKEFVFAALYGKVKKGYLSPDARKFKNLFPNVFEFCRACKTKNDLEDEEKYCWLSRHMQGIESDFVLNAVCGRFHALHSDVPIYTIHDSVLTLPEYVPVFAELVETIAQDKFGIVPSYRIE